MPIKKRGGGTIRLPQPSRQEHSKPKLSNVKRRAPMYSEYVYLDNDILSVRTPKVCSKWPHEFRLRIVRDYIEPRSLKVKSDFLSHHENIGGDDRIYKVQGIRVKFQQPYTEMGNSPNHIVVIRTDVVNVDAGKSLFLYHEDPAMRILMVYCFLTGERPGGLPKLRIAEHEGK